VAKQKWQEQLKAARACSVPVVGIQTPDQLATLDEITGEWNPGGRDKDGRQGDFEGGLVNGGSPVFLWDSVRMLQGLNNVAKSEIDWHTRNSKEDGAAFPDGDPAFLRLDEALNGIMKMGLRKEQPKRHVIIVLNAGRAFGSDSVVQAMVNLRDMFSRTSKTLILLGPTLLPLPAEIAGDTLLLDVPLPDAAEVRLRISEILTDATEVLKGDVPDDVVEASVNALLGLPAFSVEQATSLSIAEVQGLQPDLLWERKRQMIEATPGLQVYQGAERFADIGGCDNVKQEAGREIAGKAAPRAIVFIDEIEKAIGTGEDTSGVSQSLLGTLLSYMQDKDATGYIFIGPPGAAKSMFAKAMGNEAEVPTIQFDLTGMKGSLVGESERNLRQALKVVDSVSQGRALFIATCNKIADLPPELRRRFRLGTFFFDLPSTKERDQIWDLYTTKYDLAPEQAERSELNDDGWTGAEIRQACDRSWRHGVTLQQSAEYIVPVAKSAASQIEKLRSEASGRYTSANYSGTYQRDRGNREITGPGRRAFNISEREN